MSIMFRSSARSFNVTRLASVRLFGSTLLRRSNAAPRLHAALRRNGRYSHVRLQNGDPTNLAFSLSNGQRTNRAAVISNVQDLKQYGFHWRSKEGLLNIVGLDASARHQIVFTAGIIEIGMSAKLLLAWMSTV